MWFMIFLEDYYTNGTLTVAATSTILNGADQITNGLSHPALRFRPRL